MAYISALLPSGHIYMDAMGFGMGLSCLQVTFQACDITEAAQLYDQLAPLCPILLALTASSPIHRGWLSDVGKYMPELKDIFEAKPATVRYVYLYFQIVDGTLFRPRWTAVPVASVGWGK